MYWELYRSAFTPLAPDMSVYALRIASAVKDISKGVCDSTAEFSALYSSFL